MSNDTKATIVVVGGMVLFLAALAFTHAYFEARAYNRLTGANVTTWDAIFLDLRVQESTQ